MTTQNLVHGSDAGRWEQAIYAFLAEKERRSGSMRTVRAYSGMLYRFFGNLGKPPDQVTSPEVFGYAHGIGLSGKKPSSVTINARIACLSSFYRFLIRMSLVSCQPMRPVREAPGDTGTTQRLDRRRYKEAAGCNARYSSGIARPGNHSYPDPDRQTARRSTES